MGRDVLFKKIASAGHDTMVVRLERDRSLLLDVLRRGWPQAFNGLTNASITRLRIEHPIVIGGRARNNGGKWVAGFIDLAVMVCMRRPETHSDSSAREVREVFYVEVKSGQICLGELLRQINFYREYGCDGYWVVVGPDDRYADVLRGQDIAFVRMMAPQSQ